MFPLSIVVPVLDEATLIRAFLEHLRSVAPEAELIVVDGGSSDETFAIASQLADMVLQSPPGRAQQMNAGAAAARGDVLWFLHADLKVPVNSVVVIERILSDPQIAGGCFRIRFPHSKLVYRVSDSLGNLGVDLFGFALGDHGIFCRRTGFAQVGGYPVHPILEDAEFYRALHRLGPMPQQREEIVCSARTYEKLGPYRTTAVYFLILALYVLGLSIRQLTKLHRRLLVASRDHKYRGSSLSRPRPAKSCSHKIVEARMKD